MGCKWTAFLDLEVLHSTGLASLPMAASGHSGAIDKTQLPAGGSISAQHASQSDDQHLLKEAEGLVDLLSFLEHGALRLGLADAL